MATYGQKKPIGGVQLPTDPMLDMGRKTHGFVTPEQDLMPQRFSVPPRRVIPIVFIPGIMGSNLRLKAARQRELSRKNNIAWRPDSTSFCLEMMDATPAERQQLLNPTMTEVDEYDPESNPTGDANESADDRHSAVAVSLSYGMRVGINTPLLSDDPPTHPKPRTREQKARERGWGEVYYSSYSALLELCEEKLNSAYRYGQLTQWWATQIVGVSPDRWQATVTPRLAPIDEETLKTTLQGCWFPLHAMGYNWLESNENSGTKIAKRTQKLIDKYQKQGFECEKVIIITHSMGGLVARAMAHPQMGNFEDRILGIVHGVMPAIGAAATYKRMRCGFEGLAGNVLGRNGPNVTAVLANAQGGLELLPTQKYGNGWLTATHMNHSILNLPQFGDPYEEIYKLRNRWYQLVVEDWINPATDRRITFDRTLQLLDGAKRFHDRLSQYYHPHSYAHYGADPERRAWQNVTWSIHGTHLEHVHEATIISDDAQGSIRLRGKNAPIVAGMGVAHHLVNLQEPAAVGDETVPAFSADDQLRSGQFKGIFRQTGYEHQASYKTDKALLSTIYSIIRIAERMRWKK